MYATGRPLSAFERDRQMEFKKLLESVEIPKGSLKVAAGRG